MGKRAKTTTTSTAAASNSCSITSKPQISSNEQQVGPAVIPPDIDWDPCKLCATKYGPLSLRGDHLFGLYTLGPSILTKEECLAWINYGDMKGFEEIGHPEGAGYAFRANGRIVIMNEEIAEAIWLR